MPLKLTLKKPLKKRLVGQRAGLNKAKIVSTAAQQLEATGSLKVRTLAKSLGVGPTTIKFHLRGGISQLSAEIAGWALAGVARPPKPGDRPEEYLTELFWRVVERLSGKPTVARLVAIELSRNPVLVPRLAERILVFLEGLGFGADYLPRGLVRVLGRLSEIIFIECVPSNEARQEEIAHLIASNIEGLDPGEFPMLAENKNTLLEHVRSIRPPSREIAFEYAISTLELLSAEKSIWRTPSDEREEAEVDGSRSGSGGNRAINS